MRTRPLSSVRDAADPWDAGMLFLYGFVAGISAGILVCLGASWLT